jgi:uncharacterized membrane protein
MFILIILIICFSRIFISLVAMGYFYKSCTETNLATLHFVTFITPPLLFVPSRSASLPHYILYNCWQLVEGGKVPSSGGGGGHVSDVVTSRSASLARL